VLRTLIDAGQEEGVRTFEDLGCTPLEFPPRWLSERATGRRVTRSNARRMAAEARGYLARLVAKMAGDEATSADQAEYMEVLDRVLGDRVVSPDEVAVLMHLARRVGLSRTDVERAHRAYMQGLILAAWSDGTVTDVELQDLVLVGELLGVPQDEVLALVEKRPANQPAHARREDLQGKMVCFTGSLEEFRVNGEVLSRDHAHFLATQAGLQVWPRVTKKVEILVVADASTLSGKAQKAKEYGTRVVAASAFFSAIGVRLER
jgi:DNA polymerase-3 subunit epsilon